eukprot:1385418-Amorphochlora_amoeboformis.AAC.2
MTVYYSAWPRRFAVVMVGYSSIHHGGMKITMSLGRIDAGNNSGFPKTSSSLPISDSRPSNVRIVRSMRSRPRCGMATNRPMKGHVMLPQNPPIVQQNSLSSPSILARVEPVRELRTVYRTGRTVDGWEGRAVCGLRSSPALRRSKG